MRKISGAVLDTLSTHRESVRNQTRVNNMLRIGAHEHSTLQEAGRKRRISRSIMGGFHSFQNSYQSRRHSQETVLQQGLLRLWRAPGSRPGEKLTGSIHANHYVPATAKSMTALQAKRSVGIRHFIGLDRRRRRGVSRGARVRSCAMNDMVCADIKSHHR